jgi:hypothetical protein
MAENQAAAINYDASVGNIRAVFLSRGYGVYHCLQPIDTLIHVQYPGRGISFFKVAHAMSHNPVHNALQAYTQVEREFRIIRKVLFMFSFGCVIIQQLKCRGR